MVRINWQDVSYDVVRIVMSRDARKQFESCMANITHRYGLQFATESAVPAPGDFWIGCSPDQGWGDADPYRVAWASSFEIREAFAALNAVFPHPRKTHVSLMRLLFPEPSRPVAAIA
ncbi:MAG: hypothetical protein U0798_13890 [Gemmataceae bacterium]